MKKQLIALKTKKETTRAKAQKSKLQQVSEEFKKDLDKMRIQYGYGVITEMSNDLKIRRQLLSAMFNHGICNVRILKKVEVYVAKKLQKN